MVAHDLYHIVRNIIIKVTMDVNEIEQGFETRIENPLELMS